ncbi:MAG: hemerythrin domain-containing protein [Bacteroidales bacterium]
MNITRDMKMADVIHFNYSLLPVITRFGIELGFGDKTVEEVCRDNEVNLDFFIEITNSFVDDEYIPQKDLHSFSVKLIVDYLEKTHDYYLSEKIPELEKMIDEMVLKSGAGDQNSELVKNFFREYRTELENHIEREELKVQPYVVEVEKAYEKGVLDEALRQKISEYSINDFANEHDNVEEKLYDLKNIIIKYLPPCPDKPLCNRILMELFRLEKDLNAHAELEDKVLIPKVSIMEETLLKSN